MSDETMGNQQPSYTDIELGWLCGIIDGEGCVYIYRRGGKRVDYKAGIRIAMCCFDTIERISELLYRMEIPHYVTAYKGNKKKNRSPHKALVIEGQKRLLKVLPIITPHLITKKGQAAVVWQFCKERIEGWHRSEYTPNQLSLIEIAKTMNARGYSDEGSTTIRKE